MARSPAPPGPPPAHYRPPGSPRSGGLAVGTRPLGSPQPSTPPPSATGPSNAAVAAVGVGMLIIGLVFGFFIGRAVDDDPSQQAAPPTTAPTPSTTAPTGGTIPQEPPTSGPDSGAPPSTDLEPTVIGTLDSPIPFGDPYVLGVFEVTVRSADFDAFGRLSDHDAGNPEPAPDERRVLIEVGIRFVDSNGVADTSYLPFDLSNGTDVWTDLDAGCGNVPDSILDGIFLGPGDEATGNVCFTVPEGEVSGDLLLSTEGFDGPVYFALE